MAEDKNINVNINTKGIKHHWRRGGGGGALYFVGFIGAAVYFISTATTFWVGVLGFLKAIIWPAILVYQLLKFFNL